MANSPITPVKRIDSVQGLRAAAFLGIFACHAIGYFFSAFGAFGVSLFLILSGFLMVLSASGKTEPPGFSWHSAWRKIKSLYPLHIMMTLAMLALEIPGIFSSTQILLSKLWTLLLHSALVHIWLPFYSVYSSFNGVSWYLSVCFLCYLLFPFLFKFLTRKVSAPSRSFGAIVLLILSQVFISLLAGLLGNSHRESNFSVHWITYYFPPFRLVDFCIGCCLGQLYLQANPPRMKEWLVWVVEAGILVLTLASLFVFSYGSSFLAQENFRYTLLFTVPAALLIWIVSRYKTGISRILSLPVAVWFGNLTPYTFLIHPVVITYALALRQTIPMRNLVYLAVSMMITILLAIAYGACIKFKKGRRK